MKTLAKRAKLILLPLCLAVANLSASEYCISQKEGVYRESLGLTTRDQPRFGIAFPSGTSYTKAITFSGFPGHKAVIKGSDVVTGWHAGGVKFISFCHDWILKGHRDGGEV